MALSANELYRAQKYLEERKIFDKNPERFHNIALTLGKWFDGSDFVKEKIYNALHYEDPILKQDLRGKEYKNPVGLAAGYTKNADGLRFLEQFGFGYLTVGAITGQPQTGYPKQRLFRLTDELSLINGMGLNGKGANAIAEKLGKMKTTGKWPEGPVWINLANSLTTKEVDKPEEFVKMIKMFYLYADGFEIDISCPNQKGVAEMQKSGILKKILEMTQDTNERMALCHNIPKKPIVIKISPLSSYEDGDPRQADLSLEALEFIMDICLEKKVDGVTATNTTKEHIGIPEGQDQVGGMSGALLHDKSVKTMAKVKKLVKGSDIKVIGVGGLGAGKTKEAVHQTAINIANTGVDLMQMLSGFVMGGTVTSPMEVKKALVALKKSQLNTDCFRNL